MSRVERSSRRRRIHLVKTFASCCLFGFLNLCFVGATAIETFDAVLDDFASSRQNAKRSKQQPKGIIGDSIALTNVISNGDGDEIEIFDDSVEQQKMHHRWLRHRSNRNLRFFRNGGGSISSTNSTRSPNPTNGRGFFTQRSVTPPAPAPVTESKPVEPTPAPVAASENPVTPAPMTTPEFSPSLAPPSENVFNHTSPQAAPTPTPAPLVSSGQPISSTQKNQSPSPQAFPTPTPRPVVSSGQPISSSQKPQSPFSVPKAPARPPTPKIGTFSPTPATTFDGTDTAAPVSP